MFNFLFFILLVCLGTEAYSQSKFDTKIVVSVPDSANLYERVRLALIKNDFIVKDDGNKDTLSTYPVQLKTMAGSAVLWAVISGNNVELTGIYALNQLNYFGYSKPGRNSNRILYYRASKSWKILQKVAETIGGELTFKK